MFLCPLKARSHQQINENHVTTFNLLDISIQRALLRLRIVEVLVDILPHVVNALLCELLVSHVLFVCYGYDVVEPGRVEG